ncbi:MAG TPA: hypothetical protein VMJ10_10865 [Kofleriaceae bacterium]|nr:hypothetical protein [Kofleriaceae bacterium]
MRCTLFAIAGSELDVGGDSLAGYDDASASRTSVTARDTALELGTAWPLLHVALGNHADGPLAFLESGGELRAEFAGPTSTGRYFDHAATVQLLAALARLSGPSHEIERLRIFIADAVAALRGVIVHHFR